MKAPCASLCRPRFSFSLGACWGTAGSWARALTGNCRILLPGQGAGALCHHVWCLAVCRSRWELCGQFCHSSVFPTRGSEVRSHEKSMPKTRRVAVARLGLLTWEVSRTRGQLAPVVQVLPPAPGAHLGAQRWLRRRSRWLQGFRSGGPHPASHLPTHLLNSCWRHQVGLRQMGLG